MYIRQRTARRDAHEVYILVDAQSSTISRIRNEVLNVSKVLKEPPRMNTNIGSVFPWPPFLAGLTVGVAGTVFYYLYLSY